MNLFETLALIVIGIPLFDWLSVTGPAARITSFDYAYWPPSKARIASLVLLAAGLLVTLLISHPPNDSLWKLVPAGIGLVIHGVIGWLDVLRQKREAFP
ncbi:MAG: hypothetical protein ACTHJR_16410 [Sphingomonas sp.]|uniref:hypothetical protein n=1 Tax=Sphingomonas sp. TaxID=28214 RepID=UPI003F7DF368